MPKATGADLQQPGCLRPRPWCQNVKPPPSKRNPWAAPPLTRRANVCRCVCYEGWFGASCHMKHCPNHVWKSKPSDRGADGKARRVIYHAGSGVDGGLASPSDFIECSGHGHCHHDGTLSI